MFQMLIALILFLFPLAYSLGPGNMFFAAIGARSGLRASLPALLGYHIATWPITATIGFGFLAAITQFPRGFELLTIMGALYVLWIAWKMFKSGPLEGENQPRTASFIDGAVLLSLNPKAYVIIALMFTQFLTPIGISNFTADILITTVFTLNNLIAFVIWTLVGEKIAALFGSKHSARRLNTGFAALLAIVAIWMLLA